MYAAALLKTMEETGVGVLTLVEGVQDTDLLASRLTRQEVTRLARLMLEAAAALPIHGCGNATLLASNDLFQSRQAMRAGVLAHFDADVAAAHFVGHCGGSTGTEKAIENEVAGVRR